MPLKGDLAYPLQLENTLLTVPPPGSLPLIKLTDFGFCKSLVDSVARSQVGTPAYIAPEVVLCQTGYDGKAADLWSCGVMLYIMLFLKYPFQLPDNQHMHEHGLCPQLMQQIVKLEYDIPQDPPISACCKDLLSRLLCRAEHRLTIEDIKRHPWFRSGVIDVDSIWNYNELCLALDPHTHADYQSVQEIEHILRMASMPHLSEQRCLSRQLSEASSGPGSQENSLYGAIDFRNA
eukprot:jgi/Botrbrau1/11605/Bobra.247_1s0019.1